MKNIMRIMPIIAFLLVLIGGSAFAYADDDEFKYSFCDDKVTHINLEVGERLIFSDYEPFEDYYSNNENVFTMELDEESLEGVAVAPGQAEVTYFNGDFNDITVLITVTEPSESTEKEYWAYWLDDDPSEMEYWSVKYLDDNDCIHKWTEEYRSPNYCSSGLRVTYCKYCGQISGTLKSLKKERYTGKPVIASFRCTEIGGYPSFKVKTDKMGFNISKNCTYKIEYCFADDYSCTKNKTYARNKITSKSAKTVYIPNNKKGKNIHYKKYCYCKVRVIMQDKFRGDIFKTKWSTVKKCTIPSIFRVRNYDPMNW